MEQAQQEYEGNNKSRKFSRGITPSVNMISETAGGKSIRSVHKMNGNVNDNLAVAKILLTKEKKLRPEYMELYNQEKKDFNNKDFDKVVKEKAQISTDIHGLLKNFALSLDPTLSEEEIYFCYSRLVVDFYTRMNELVTGEFKSDSKIGTQKFIEEVSKIAIELIPLEQKIIKSINEKKKS